MEISSVGASALTEDIQAQYAVKLIKMQQESTETVGNIIQDTVEISNEAMQRFMAERNAQ